ncbi:hypothetical protein ACF0H5_000315 [Mactra antiquata]
MQKPVSPVKLMMHYLWRDPSDDACELNKLINTEDEMSEDEIIYVYDSKTNQLVATLTENSFNDEQLYYDDFTKHSSQDDKKTSIQDNIKNETIQEENKSNNKCQDTIRTQNDDMKPMQDYYKEPRVPKCCLAACRKDASVRTAQRRMEEEHSPLSLSSYEEFINSVYVTEIREKFMCRPYMHLKDMTGILIVLTRFCNWPHVSVNENVRFVDIERATTDDDNLYIINVGKHKTSGMGRGKKAAFRSVNKDIYSELKLYARTVRDVFKPIDISAQLFRGNTGQRADINRLAKSTWRKAGMPEEFSLTQMKKLTTVHLRKINTAMAGEKACQLCHRESTADQYYDVHDDRQSAVRVYKHLKQSFSRNGPLHKHMQKPASPVKLMMHYLWRDPSDDACELNKLIDTEDEMSEDEIIYIYDSETNQLVATLTENSFNDEQLYYDDFTKHSSQDDKKTSIQDNIKNETIQEENKSNNKCQDTIRTQNDDMKPMQGFYKEPRVPKCCLAACRKDASVRTAQRRMEEEHSPLSLSSYEEFINSVYVTEIREKFMCRPYMHLKDMTGILIVLTRFCNWPHVSVNENVRFVDIERATTDDDNLYIINVGKHKTSGMGRGKKAAFRSVNKDIYSELKLYARTVRDVFKPIVISAQLFRGNTGQRADINRLAKSTWRKAGMPEEFSLTQMKKLTTVHLRKINTAMAGEIACQLCHRESTADQYYDVHDDRQSAVRVYKHLKQSFSRNGPLHKHMQKPASPVKLMMHYLWRDPSDDACELNKLIDTEDEMSEDEIIYIYDSETNQLVATLTENSFNDEQLYYDDFTKHSSQDDKKLQFKTILKMRQYKKKTKVTTNVKILLELKTMI